MVVMLMVVVRRGQNDVPAVGRSVNLDGFGGVPGALRSVVPD
jgi:hypothetical protein